MADSTGSSALPPFDPLIRDIADYVCHASITSAVAMETAHHCLMDSLGCALLALRFPECAKLLGPHVPGTQVPLGARVPGTRFELDPVKAAFDIGCCIRWLDYNDTWLAAEWGHPSDNLGALLAVADFQSRRARSQGRVPLLMQELLTAMVKAHEIQGILALSNSFNAVGLDHVLLVKLASTALVTQLLGGSHEQVMAALSQALVDGQALRTYRHAPNAGPRKSWAAGDAASRAVRLALITLAGEPGYPSALSAKPWGMEAVLMQGRALTLAQHLGSYVMENVLFKIAFPAEFHGQTAVECAFKLHAEAVARLEELDRIEIQTQESAMRIINKAGPLNNFADRDHCLQYMVAVGLLFGELRAEYFEDGFHQAHPQIDNLRAKMTVSEDKSYSRDYLDGRKRSIANAVQLFFKDGSHSAKVEVQYPLGHRRRRAEGIPRLKAKFEANLASRFPKGQAEAICALLDSDAALRTLPVDDFMALLQI
ncbi:bifunctional 2-methylcitrate dehydratase/aconitate hydratase [Gallaecimonas kandeliae]|uniref:bifunctional 2-methylcitrate dehydratase/aconitate hydratase n=1 Tax=Gallaecimonas kandeliae TaxID=3029055 RepID=UPI002647BEEE|nr:bifunctional 2-methylcitrate dehydratase/aconitate hydratase [Gallaecimonas kandeliae]WKE67376.1 bifunctional 2-methylcitrate dehydratase/aconitate hydratase [Gallaecimonas kandeliae]